MGTTTIFHWDTNHVVDHFLVHSVDKIHVLVVTVELIWLLFLNIFFLKFVPTLNKSLMSQDYKKLWKPLFCRSNQGYTAFLLDVRYSSWPRLAAVCRQCICVTYFLLSTMLLECCYSSWLDLLFICCLVP